LTALFLSLMGSCAYKKPWKRWDNPATQPKEETIYLNLLALAEDQEHDLFYGFFFLVESEAAKRDEDIHWFKIADYRTYQSEVSDRLIVLARFTDPDSFRELPYPNVLHLKRARPSTRASESAKGGFNGF